MQITHIAIYTEHLEISKAFYETYFNASAGELYHNPNKGFSSYFLSFSSGARLELMHQLTVNQPSAEHASLGLTHLAISVGDKRAVDQLTHRLRQDGYPVLGEPRTTGDGYYESVVLAPDGVRLEITI